jgi:hypothetical protein
MRPSSPPARRAAVRAEASGPENDLNLSEKAEIARAAVHEAIISQDPAQMRRALLLVEESALEHELVALDRQQAARQQDGQVARVHRRKRTSTCALCKMALC